MRSLRSSRHEESSIFLLVSGELGGFIEIALMFASLIDEIGSLSWSFSSVLSLIWKEPHTLDRSGN